VFSSRRNPAETALGSSPAGLSSGCRAKRQIIRPILAGARGASMPPVDTLTPAKPPTGQALVAEIQRLRKERNAVILAHYYQDSEIQDLADFLGDSLALAQYARKTTADVIAFCGVHFMAETAKIVNPERTVVIPDLDAGCSLADACPPAALADWKRLHPDYAVIAYINCSAGVKALSDCICTSSNALAVVNSFPKDQKILFVPDRNLGRWLIQKSGREMKLWQGTCIVHETFSERKILDLRAKYPDAEFVCHPEAEPGVVRLADFVGSTTGLLRYVADKSKAARIIVGTETGILHQMRKAAPTKELIAVPYDGDQGCRCNECPHMKKNTLTKLYLCLRDLTPKIEMDEDIRRRALAPLERMLAISAGP
jgi:quinolinate synthase